MKPDDFSKAVEVAYKEALKGADAIKARAEKIREQAQRELDAAKEARAQAEKDSEKMAREYFEGRQKQFMETARTELLRRLVRTHLEAGKTPRDIANWLDVPMNFIENIRQLLERLEQYAGEKRPRTQLDSQPKLRYQDMGRGGTIWFESVDSQFDMWWEFAGGDALVIVDVPSAEQWETRTKLPLAEREKVLQFVGEQIIVDKNGGRGSFVVGENVITFYA